MKATVLDWKKTSSKYGGYFWYVFFKGEDGKSYRSCITPDCANFKRWVPYIGKTGIVLDNLRVRRGCIDADSYPKEVSQEGV